MLTHGFVLLIAVALLGRFSGMHADSVPLRGYTCKKNAQRPCRLCPLGHFCPDKDLMRPCGGMDVYCPIGSSVPTPVTEGHFTTPTDLGEDVRYDEEQCPAGYYCLGGAKRVCPAGYYCPREGTVEPVECGNSTVFCVEGSILPERVSAGFFTVGGLGNTTRDGQRIAPLGYYASEGQVKPCREGHYGSVAGLSDESCSGTCEAGKSEGTHPNKRIRVTREKLMTNTCCCLPSLVTQDGIAHRLL